MYRESAAQQELLSCVMQMPISIQTTTYRELEQADLPTQIFRARQLTLAKTMQQMHEQAQVIDTGYMEEIRGDQIRVTCTLTATINIATTQEVYGK